MTLLTWLYVIPVLLLLVAYVHDYFKGQTNIKTLCAAFVPVLNLVIVILGVLALLLTFISDPKYFFRNRK